jgi:hypothetical protein
VRNINGREQPRRSRLATPRRYIPEGCPRRGRASWPDGPARTACDAPLSRAEDLFADPHEIGFRPLMGGDLGDDPAEQSESLRHRAGIVGLSVKGPRIIPVPPPVFGGIPNPVGRIVVDGRVSDFQRETLEDRARIAAEARIRAQGSSSRRRGR